MRKFNITVNGQSYDVQVDEIGGAAAPAMPVAAPAVASAPAAAPVAAPAPAAVSVPASGTKINAPMPGNIVEVSVKTGDSVKCGDKLVVLEAMKMENDITSPVDGTVASISVNKGDVVSTNDLLVVVG